MRTSVTVFTFSAISCFVSALRLTFYPTVSLGAAVFRDPSWLHLVRVHSVPCASCFHSILFPQSAKNRISPSSNTTGIRWRKKGYAFVLVLTCVKRQFYSNTVSAKQFQNKHIIWPLSKCVVTDDMSYLQMNADKSTSGSTNTNIFFVSLYC